MISKYFLGASVLIVNLLLFSSCLSSSDNNMEYPTDPQIYAISISSATDTTSLLPGVVFTIDQVNGKLFNREPLPYGFHVDSVMLSLTGSTSYGFSGIEVTLEPDSSYAWSSSDSIAIPRLRKIKTTAPDGVTSKNYDFQLNIYQEDPYILTWKKIGENYLNSPVESQATILYGDRFYTYYRSGDEIKAVSTEISDTPGWEAVDDLPGIPHTLRLSSLITSGNIIYALDAATGAVYHSPDGAKWSIVQTEYEVKAIYGELPNAAAGNILLAVSHDEKVRFARASNDFSDIVLMNDLPANMPVIDFTAMKVESKTSYASKFIFLSGGNTTSDALNNDIWILQEDGGVIQYITSKRPDGILKGSSLFYYDDKPYLIATSAGKNILMYSDNYGKDWIKAEENQSFPENFAGRTNTSVVTDADNNIWIFGGISSSNTQLVDIWKGRLNKFALD